jgi:hypothetical protein
LKRDVFQATFIIINQNNDTGLFHGLHSTHSAKYPMGSNEIKSEELPYRKQKAVTSTGAAKNEEKPKITTG